MFPDMPQNAIDAAGPQHVVAAASIAQLLTEIVSRPRTGEEVMAPSKGPGVGERPADPIGASDVNGSPTGLSCPECHGVVWASADLDGPPYRCRTGHSFSEEALLDVQVDALENALWAAVRALQENSSLNQALARRAGRRGDQRSAASFSNRSEDAAQQAKLIEGMLVQRAEPAEEQGERD
jgi:two-component system chemotaxis response regulator CheB